MLCLEAIKHLLDPCTAFNAVPLLQTIGGAVSTGTHGSSLKWGSLSSQVVALHTVLANGTVRVFDDESDPFLMKVRVSAYTLTINCVCHVEEGATVYCRPYTMYIWHV